MDYRYVDQQSSHRGGASSHDDPQGLNHHPPPPQHLQHLSHFAPHQHSSLQPPPPLPHQHMHHVGQPVFVAAAGPPPPAHSSRDAYVNRRQSGQDLQSILEVAGLVPVRPPTQLSQHPHPQDQQRQQSRVAESRTQPQSMQLHPDSQLLTTSSQREYNTVTTTLQQHQQQQQQGEYHRDYRAQPPPQSVAESQGDARQPQQQDSGMMEIMETPQQPSQQAENETQPHPPSHNNSNDHDSDLEPPPTIVLKDNHRPGPLPHASLPSKLPEGLLFMFGDDEKKAVGVKTEKKLEADVELGTFHGALVDTAAGCVEESAWELCLLGEILYYVDGKYKRNENWLLRVQCARNSEEQNLEAIQRYGYVHFRTTKVIEPGSELRVFYSEEYGRQVGFRSKLDDLEYKEDTDNFQCSQCMCFYKSAKRMMRHIKLAHDTDHHPSKVRPLFSWEVKKKISEVRQPSIAVDLRNDNRFICVTCGKDFPTAGRLAAHETFHDFAGGLFTCDFCGEGCETAQILAKHLQTHQAKNHRCELCGKEYLSWNNLRRHERVTHGWVSTRLSCERCGGMFDSLGEFKKHQCTKKDGVAKRSRKGAPSKLVKQDQDLLLGGEGNASAKPDDKSPPDDASMAPMDMLGKRLSFFDRPRPYKCRHCSMKFRQYNQRKYHEQEVHEGKGTYQCPQCGQRFVTRCNLDAHLKKHNPIRPFQCQVCPRGFASEKALNNHQGEHTGLKPYKCNFCGRGFRTQKLMGKHRTRMHGKREKRFPCSYCDKRFMERSSWRNHERRHKGIRPFVCLTCGKGFSSKDSMFVHQRVHTGEMPFKCTKCGKQFRNNHNLTAHLLHHAKEDEEAA